MVNRLFVINFFLIFVYFLVLSLFFCLLWVGWLYRGMFRFLCLSPFWCTKHHSARFDLTSQSRFANVFENRNRVGTVRYSVNIA